MAAPVEEASVTRTLAALEAMVAEVVAVAAAALISKVVTEAPVAPMAEAAEAVAHTVQMTAQLLVLVVQKAPMAALAVQAASILNPKAKLETLGQIPLVWDWILKALAPEALPPPRMVAEAAVAATEASEAQEAPEVLPEAAVAEATAESEAQEAPTMVVALAEVAVAMAAMAVPEEAAFTELAVEAATEKPEMAEQEQPQKLRPTTAGLPQEAEASVPIFHPTSIMALADLVSALSPTTHKEARQ